MFSAARQRCRAGKPGARLLPGAGLHAGDAHGHDAAETAYVKIVIGEVYPGTHYDDTCLAEIEVWGKVK